MSEKIEGETKKIGTIFFVCIQQFVLSSANLYL